MSESYPDGRPSKYYQTLDSLPDGEWMEWYPDGTLRYRAEWKAGKGYGLWEYFYPSGQLRSREVYENDLPIGIATTYHPNGQLAEESVYIGGRLHGLKRTYSPTGQPLALARYRQGQRVIDRPESFAPGIISTGANEWGLSFTPAADTVYFTRRPVGQSQQRIYRSTLADTGWTAPIRAAFSTATDESPFLSRDGRWLYFASFRPIPGKPPLADNDMNLWRVRRRNGGYGSPSALGPTINRIREQKDRWPYAYEAGPFLDRDGRLYYWSTLDRGGSADLLRSQPDDNGAFGKASPLTTLNTPAAESAPAISPDGNYLVFSSYDRAGGYGLEDLYFAVRSGDGYSDPVNLGPLINGQGNEGCATFSPDGKYFYFCRDEGEGTPSNLFYLESEFLPLPE